MIWRGMNQAGYAGIMLSEFLMRHTHCVVGGK